MRDDAAIPAPPRWLAPFGGFVLLVLVVAQAVGLLAPAPDHEPGDLQRIMSVHVPAARTALLAFVVVFAASALYLWQRQERHDLLAAAAAETGAVMTALALMLGSIWGRPTWGVWWTWDPRLTATAILLLIYVSYLALRAFTEDDEKQARWSAAVGILGFINVPIVYMSVTWWRTLHPPQSPGAAVDSPFTFGLGLNDLAFLLLLIYFVAARYYIARVERVAESRLEERDQLEEGARG